MFRDDILDDIVYQQSMLANRQCVYNVVNVAERERVHLIRKDDPQRIAQRIDAHLDGLIIHIYAKFQTRHELSMRCVFVH